MNQDTCEIDSITFGVYSPAEIRAMSTCALDSVKRTGYGTVYDPRMGTTDSGYACETCGESPHTCPGHFGRIEFHEPIVHPLYYKRVLTYLNCYCMQCSRMYLTREQMELTQMHKLPREQRLARVAERVKKTDICMREDCRAVKPVFVYSQADNSYAMTYSAKLWSAAAARRAGAAADHQDDTEVDTEDADTEDVEAGGAARRKAGQAATSACVEGSSSNSGGGGCSYPLTTEEIRQIFDSIPDEEVSVLGFDPRFVHPRNYILTVLPVIPPCDRTYVKSEGMMCDDHLTNQYIEIIKFNNHLAPQANGSLAPQTARELRRDAQQAEDGYQVLTKRQKALASIRFRVLTTFNNSNGKAKHTTNRKAIKGIKERLTGKEGQIRKNMMGKRCDQTARTVIGPDPTLRMGELAVPVEIANVLTVPVRVTAFNIAGLQALVDAAKVDTLIKPDNKTVIDLKRRRRGMLPLPGDLIYRPTARHTALDALNDADPDTQPGKWTVTEVVSGRERVLHGDKIKRDGAFLAKLIPADRGYELEIGWTVERKLSDGDYVLLNRQPTLHKASMMAMQVVVKPYRTFRMNLAITKPFNADFDGDEMNIHVPQTPEAQAELRFLSAAQCNVISPQSSKPNMVIVQDSLLGAYRMTLGVQHVPRARFFDISMKLDLTAGDTLARVKHIAGVLRAKGAALPVYTGKGLVSLFLPGDLDYTARNDADPEQPTVRIHRGVLYQGTLDKCNLGASHASLIGVLHKEYGPAAASRFVDCLQFATNEWLQYAGFSVGLGDCMATSDAMDKHIQDVVRPCYIQAEEVHTTTSHVAIREVRINAALNKAKDVGLRLAKNALLPTNNFLSTVRSGSKGDFFNIAQITGLLGQQNLKGSRIPCTLNHQARTLPHYPFGELPIDLKYESRGFIGSSFIRGLNPRQFYFHAMSGREGISDTAMSTATSGYMQRRIVKLTEDIKVQYDGSVRDVQGRVYQMAYGELGVDPTATVKVGADQQICDVTRLVNRLNARATTGAG